MQFKNLLLATALTAGVSADFAIFTVPTPTDLGILANPASFISSVQNYVTQQLGSLTASAAPSAASRAASANSALQQFVKTASVSVPSGITDLGAYQTFTSVPSWYSALPSDLKSYYDQNNNRVQSIINQAVLGTAAPSGSAVSGTAKPSGTTAGTSSTGAANSEKVVQYVGAGMLAAFAGVVAL